MGRAPCCEKVGLKRGRWTMEEDELLTKYIQENGEGSWRSLPKNAGLLRCGKSCRLRWINYLKAGLKRGNISTEEEDLIVKLHTSYGNRWSLIASQLPGRTDNEIKNYWNSHLSRKIYSFRRATIVDTTLAGLTDTPKVPNNPPKPKSRRGGKTSRWAMKKNKIYTQKGNKKPKLQNAPQHNEEVPSVPPPSTPSLESEVNLSCCTIEDFMVLDLDNNHNNNNNNMVEKEKEEEEPISSDNNDNTNENEEKEGLEFNLEVQNFPIYEKENNNDMLVLEPYNVLVEDINVDDGVLGFDDNMMGTLMLEASRVLTSCQENETNNNNNNNNYNNSVVGFSCEDLGENNNGVNDCWDLGNLDDCWDWESGLELKNNDNCSIIIDDEIIEGSNNNWEQRENLLAWLWEDDDLESECINFGEIMDAKKQNDDMLAWFLS